jgi:hypothetical protein
MSRVEDAIGVFMIPLFMALVVILAIVVSIFAARQKKKRREQIGQFAQRHGFQMLAEEPAGCLTGGLFGSGRSGPGAQLIQMFEGFEPFGVGDSRLTDMVVLGGTADRTFYFFDYQYSTGSGKNRSTHHFGIAAVRVPCLFKRLSLRPEGFFDRFGAALGFKDIQFEMEEFNRRYHVQADDEKAAFDLVHPGMIDYLMSVPERHWQLLGNYMLVHRTGPYNAIELEEVMTDMGGFLDLIPEYVLQDIAFQAKWNSPLE